MWIIQFVSCKRISGPIIAIMKFSFGEKATILGNDTNYGLGCVVFFGIQHQERLIAPRIHFGFAVINDFDPKYMCQPLPFGGVNNSRCGRIIGIKGLCAYCLIKIVVEDRCWLDIKTKMGY